LIQSIDHWFNIESEIKI